MKARIIILCVLLISLTGCAASFETSETPQEKAIKINNHELGGRDTKIGGTVVIKYDTTRYSNDCIADIDSTRYLNDCITDMESRGYVVKQVEEQPSIIANDIIIVVYERRK